MKAVWVGLIRFYQRWLSPLKGFRCAHAAVHGELTCSEAVKRIVEEDGLWGGRRRIRRRMRECRAAARALLIQAGPPLPDKPPVRLERLEQTDDRGSQDSPQRPPPDSYFKTRRRSQCVDGCDADVACCVAAPMPCDCDCFPF